GRNRDEIIQAAFLDGKSTSCKLLLKALYQFLLTFGESWSWLSQAFVQHYGCNAKVNPRL
ncbi:hypothetical protein, partial [Achromobacter marplatensis]|uniref:hypothetical protein n=1 Tax=Achromobacter marplatensis TaxID=470868 RepID=UPI001F3FCDFF